MEMVMIAKAEPFDYPDEILNGDEVAAPQPKKTTFRIHEWNMAAFEEKCRKLSRKSLRIIGVAIEPQILGYEDVQARNRDGGWPIDGVFHRYFNVFFDFEPVKIPGWSFVARIDHSLEGGNIVSSSPDYKGSLPERFRSIGPICEHCDVQRYRKDTFVFQHEDGDFKQVGRSCLKQFFGIDPQRIALLAEYMSSTIGMDEEPDERMGGGDRQERVRVLTFLGHTATMIRVHGWMSASAANKFEGREDVRSTRSLAMENMFPRKATKWEPNPPKPLSVTDDDKATASAALEWAQRLEEKAQMSDYESNINVIAKSEVIALKMCGMAASIVAGYLREQDRLIQMKRNLQSQKDSRHIGTIGEMIRKVPARLIGHSSRETDYGIMHIYRFLTQEGNVMVWFSSTRIEIQTNSDVIFSGKVKKHDVYNEIKQTVMSHCKVTQVDARPEE